MINVNSLPIVIISSPRTGSTALAMTLQNKLGGVLFNEPGNENIKLNDFLRYASLKKDFILKEHAENYLKKYSNFDLNKCTVIRIKRKDLVSQVVSSYISNKRNKWFYTDKDAHYQDEEMIYDETFLKECFNHIKNQNKICENFKGKIDVDLFYEDILSELLDNQKTILPKNYTEIVKWAEVIYAED
jgi:LPS sulfotransferase NodH